MLKKFIIFLNLNCNFIRATTDVFLVNFCIICIRIQQYFSHFKMKQFLFYFRVHQNLIRNISFQKSFVDVSLKPLFAKKLVNQAKRNYILSLEIFSSANALLIVLFETEICQILNYWNEDVFRVIFLELRRSCVSFDLVCCFLYLVVDVWIATVSCLIFIHLSDKLGFNKYLIMRSECKFKLFQNKK